jgi:UDP-N-acetylmuramyl pentapeptide phosphotransferase/UDP-N-acetylglucosamine-1-phosphate transferase
LHGHPLGLFLGFLALFVRQAWCGLVSVQPVWLVVIANFLLLLLQIFFSGDKQAFGDLKTIPTHQISNHFTHYT